jgi:hypothetical protein
MHIYHSLGVAEVEYLFICLCFATRRKTGLRKARINCELIKEDVSFEKKFSKTKKALGKYFIVIISEAIRFGPTNAFDFK